jgi:hypothetical protein
MEQKIIVAYNTNYYNIIHQNKHQTKNMKVSNTKTAAAKQYKKNSNKNKAKKTHTHFMYSHNSSCLHEAKHF